MGVQGGFAPCKGNAGVALLVSPETLPLLKHQARGMKYKKYILTFLFYLILFYLLFAFSIAFSLNTSYLGKYSHDQISYIWALYWLPFAISHHLNPFFSTFIWHPYGTVLSIAPESVPGA